MKNILLTSLLVLISNALLAQRFDARIKVAGTYYEPQGVHAYILASAPSKSLYKYNIEDAKIDAQWEVDFDKADMFFVNEDVYIWASTKLDITTFDSRMLKLNRETNQFEEYYRKDDVEKDFRVLGVNQSGEIMLFDVQSLRGNSVKQAYGWLYIRNVIKDTRLSLEFTICGNIHTFRPMVQPFFTNKVAMIDYSKMDIDKRKFILQDVIDRKNKTILKKKIEYGNYVIYGFGDVFIFEFHDDDSPSSQFIVFDAEGDELAEYSWDTYISVRYDYGREELYFLTQDKSKFDVFSAKDRRIVRSVKAFPYWSSKADEYHDGGNGNETITNGKKYRLISELQTNDLAELIGYFESYNFETGVYEPIGKPLREGYSFDDYNELKTMVDEMKADENKTNLALATSAFKADIAAIPFLSRSGNQTTIANMEVDLNAGKVYKIAQVAAYNEPVEKVVKVAECDDKVVVLVTSRHQDMKYNNNVQRTVTTEHAYLSVVNSGFKYDQIKMVAQEVTVVEYNTVTKESLPADRRGSSNFSWTDNGDTFSVRGGNESYSVNKSTCTIQ